MALIKFSSLVNDVRGSVGGVTFSRARGGATARARVAPINPTTSRRTEVRQNFGNLAKYWSETLTSAQRTAWENYAAIVPIVNSLGESVFLSGFSRFVGNNAGLIDAGGTLRANAPNVAQAGNEITQSPILSAVLNAAGDVLSISLNTSFGVDSQTSERIFIAASKPLPAGRTFPAGGFSRVYTNTVADAEGDLFEGNEQTEGVTAGQAIFFRAYRATADARIGTPYIQKVIVTQSV